MLKILLFPLLILSTMSLASAEFTEASYTVPVPFEFAKFATFKMPKSLVELNNGVLEVTYYLPLEIVPLKLHETAIHLKGMMKRFPDHFEMIEDEGVNKAQCLLRNDGLTCLVSYGFTPDIEQVLEFIKSTYPKTEYEDRALVVRTFGGEAGGIVHFPVNLVH